MKKSFGTLFALFLLCTAALFAQETESRSFFAKADHIYVQSSFSYENFETPTIFDFINLSPYLTPTQEILSYRQLPMRAMSFSLMPKLGFDLGKGERSSFWAHSELRLGLGFRQAILLREEMYRNEIFGVDTLLYLGSGEKMPVDSINNKVYKMFYVTRGVQLSAEWILRSNTAKGISFYGGAGINAAYQFANYTYIRHEQNIAVGGRLEVEGLYFRKYREMRTIEYESPARSSLSATVFLPLGIQLRVGRKSKHKEAAFLYYEARPAWSYARIPELERNLSAFTLGHSLGLRVSLP